MNKLIDMEGLLDAVRREIDARMAARQQPMSLIATAYDPDTHTIKGILMPSGVESDWIRIGASHAGNGFGILVGPKVGDPKKLDGDQFTIDFEGGDPNAPVARHRTFSSQDKPPKVESGEMCIKHTSGNMLFFDKDGQITIKHKSGGSILWDNDGKMITDNGNREVKVTGNHVLSATTGGHLA